MMDVSRHTMTTTTNDCDPNEQLARQNRLEDLYEADGRGNPDHPMHGLYTGLHQQEVSA
jgi:hypothetical protein